MIKLKKTEVLTINKLVKKKGSLESFTEYFNQIGYSVERHDEIFESLLISKEEVQFAHQKHQNRDKLNPSLKKALAKLYTNDKPITSFYAELKAQGFEEAAYDKTLEQYGYHKNDIKGKATANMTNRIIGIVILMIFGSLSIALFTSGWIIGITLCLAAVGFYMIISGEAPY